MKLFSKRPLSLILCIMLGGFYFFVGRENTVYLIATVAPTALIAIIFIFKSLFQGRRRIITAALIAFLLSVLLSFAWSRTYFPLEHYGKEVDIEATVISADHTDTVHSTVVIRTETIDGKRDRHTVRIAGYKNTLSGINTGDRVQMRLTILKTEEGDKSYYTALGYSAVAGEPVSASVIGHGEFTLRYYFDLLRDNIADRFRLVSNKATGDFLSALLTGERESIDPNTRLNFTRAGISHILALSGAHLVILAFAANALLRSLRLNNKIRTVIVMLLVVLYMMLTGLSACVTRAGVMLLITSTLYLISERSDGVTSLTISVFLIVCAQPYSIYDVSLWLSALATLGLIFLSTISRRNESTLSLPRRILHVFRDAILASVFAISASIIVSMLTFDSFSTLSVPATIIFAPLTNVLMYLGLFGLIFGGIIPMNAVLILSTDFIKLLAEVFARPDFALVSFDFTALRVIAILLAVCFFALIVFADRKSAKRIVIVITSIFVLLNVSAIICSTAVKHDDGVVYSSGEYVDVLLVRSDGESALIASGSGKYVSRTAANTAKDAGVLSVDLLILPSYHTYSVELVEDTVSTILVDTVYLPKPETTDEYVMAQIVASKLSGMSADLRFYTYREAVHIGDTAYMSISRMQLASKRSDDCFVLATDGHLFAYVSTDIVNNYLPDVTAVINGCDTLVIGSCCGTVTIMPKNAERVHLGYGSEPSESTKEYLNEKGASVSNTDAPVKFDFD